MAALFGSGATVFVALAGMLGLAGCSGGESADDTRGTTSTGGQGGGAGAGGDAGTAGTPTSGPDASPHPLDGILRLNHFQMLATHNSYHIEPPGNGVPDWAFTRDPLDVQFELGVRSVEIDTGFDPATGEVIVRHVPTLDDVSVCSPLSACLAVMRAWSDEHPWHHPLFIHLEPKDDEFGATFDFVPYVDAVEAAILDAFPRDRVIAPDDVQGDDTTLREAVVTRGWPTLGASRQKILFYLNETAQFSDALTRGGTSLEGRLIFPEAPIDSPLAAVLVMNDPASGIGAVVSQGFIVRTRADDLLGGPDEARRAVGLESGAQLLTTDFPPTADGTAPDGGAPFTIPGGDPSRCNPMTAPAGCTAADIENTAVVHEPR